MGHSVVDRFLCPTCHKKMRQNSIDDAYFCKKNAEESLYEI